MLFGKSDPGYVEIFLGFSHPLDCKKLCSGSTMVQGGEELGCSCFKLVGDLVLTGIFR